MVKLPNVRITFAAGDMCSFTLLTHRIEVSGVNKMESNYKGVQQVPKIFLPP